MGVRRSALQFGVERCEKSEVPATDPSHPWGGILKTALKSSPSMKEFLKRIRGGAFVATVVWGIGPGCPPPPPQGFVEINGYRVVEDGTKMEVSLYVSPPAGTLYVRCPDYTPFDTVVVGEDWDSVTYLLDSTFLTSCTWHQSTVFTYSYGGERSTLFVFYDVPIGYVGYPNRPRRLVIDSRDTISVHDDSSGYVLTSNGHVRFRSYDGEMYAPVPPVSYSDTLGVSDGDTVIVWIDHDRDGALGYDGDDLFGVLIVTSDDLSLRIVASLRPSLPLTGYRGLDLCFGCAE